MFVQCLCCHDVLNTPCFHQVAAWIGLTRIEDFWHFETDVVGGWLVGAGSAWLAYVCVAGYCRAEVMYEVRRCDAMSCPCSLCCNI